MTEPSEPDEEHREWLRDGGCIDNAQGVRYLIKWLERGKALLAKQGLHLVSEADKRVLEASELVGLRIVTEPEQRVLDAAYAYAKREDDRGVFSIEGDLRAAAMGLVGRGEKA